MSFEKGYTMINHNDNFFYYVLGEAAGYTYPTYEKISNEFQLTTFANGQQVAQEQLAQTQAIALSVWADVPEAQTSREVIQAIFGSKRPSHKRCIKKKTAQKAAYQNYLIRG